MPISEAKFEELKNLVSDMKNDIAINQRDSVHQWELIKTTTTGQIEVATTKIVNLDSTINKLNSDTQKRFDSNDVWTRWGVGLAVGLVITIFSFGLNSWQQGNRTAEKVDGVSGRIGDLQKSVDRLASNPRPDDPVMRAAVIDLPNRVDRIDQKIDRIVNSQVRLPFERITCEGTAFSQGTPSSLLLTVRSGIRPVKPGVIPEGLYVATVSEREPNGDASLPYVPSELVKLPIRIIVSVADTNSATISMQFLTLEELTRFRTAVTPIGRMMLDISGDQLNQQMLKAH
jgi:hypothetical protein